jgi:hypothetical protein
LPHPYRYAKIADMEPYGYYPAYTKAVDHLDEFNPDALFANGLEAACVGHTEIWLSEGQRISLAVYSKQKIVRSLAETEDMSFSDAEEYAEFNIYNAYMGPHTPIFVDEAYNPAPTVLAPPIAAEDMYEL